MATWKEALEQYRSHLENENLTATADPMAMYGKHFAVFQKGQGYRVYNGTCPTDVNSPEEVEAMLQELGIPADVDWY